MRQRELKRIKKEKKEIVTLRERERERERHIVKEDELKRKQRNSYKQLERKSNICT